jgi:hypothetical protein
MAMETGQCNGKRDESSLRIVKGVARRLNGAIEMLD